MTKQEAIKLIKKTFTKEIKELGYKLDFVKNGTFDLDYPVYEKMERTPVALNHVAELNEKEIIEATKEMVVMIDEDCKKKNKLFEDDGKEKTLWTYKWTESNIHTKENLEIIVLPFIQIIEPLQKEMNKSTPKTKK